MTQNGISNNNSGPILLFGMPRSGTTWVGKLFDSHPATLYRHEPDSVERFDPLPLAPSFNFAEQQRSPLQAFIKRIPHMRAAKASAQLPLFPKAYLSPGAFMARRVWILGGKVAERVLGRWPVLAFATPKQLDRARLVWKSIESVGRLALVLEALPDARAILILRHPCGQAASVLAGHQAKVFDSDTASEEDWGAYEQLLESHVAQHYGLTLSKIKAASPAARLAWRWVILNEHGLFDAKQNGHETRLQVLVYEQLCAQPESVLKQLYQFVGLDWNSQTQAFVNESTGKDKDAYYSVYKDPLKAANSWKQKLNSEQVADIEGVLAQSRLAEYFQ